MSLPILAIHTAHLSFSEVLQQPETVIADTLGAICFVESSAGANSAKVSHANTVEFPMLQLQAPILDGTHAACETWSILSSAKTLAHGTHGAIHYCLNDELLFGVISVPEGLPAQHKAGIAPLQYATESAYRQIFELMETLDYLHIYRFWNYIADINVVSHGLERYRQFNVGRKDALLACKPEVASQLPAACALGLAAGPLTIAFLLGRKAAVAVENPRQVSAYDYPDEYGPRTPSFSRATLLRNGQQDILFISGTASIVGHQTKHEDDVEAQTMETLANLEAVIAEANRMLGKPEFELRDTFMRVYVRSAADLPLVRDAMQRYLGGAFKAVFIQADICRQELLLEIEATAGQLSDCSCTR